MKNLNIESSRRSSRNLIPWEGSATAVGEVAHDLRAILAVVKGYTELLLEESEKLNSDSSQSFCNKIMRSCRQMQDLVDNCLDLGRLASGRLPVRLQQLDLVSFLEEIVSGLALTARAKEITLLVDMGDRLPAIHTDPQCLGRIVGNLLGNACKFSPRGTTVQISARSAGSWVELEVRDQGPGLATAEVPDLFEAYQSGSVRPTAGEKSTGLGLAIVKQLVTALGGTICVRSRPGEGAAFNVLLPCCSADN